MKKTLLSFVFAAITMMAMAEISDFKKEIKLYPNGAPDSNGYTTSDEYTSGSGWYQVATPKMYTYLPTSGTTKGTILVIPGGGYGMIAYTNEGSAVAKKLVADGWAAAVLKYRLPNGHDSIPLRDACRAMELLKDSAAQWGLNPDGKFGVAGFSAGGHLASTLVTKYITEKSRPDFGILTYPVITLESGKTHNGTRVNLLGNSPSKAKENAWSTHTQVTGNTPPCLLVLCQDDATVPTLSSVLMFNALNDKDIYTDMVIVPAGGHGWGASTSIPQRDVIEDAVFTFIDSTIIPPTPSSPSRLSPLASRQSPSSRIYLYGSGDGYVDVYAPKSFTKSIILSLTGTDEQVSRFVDDNYKVFVLSCRPGVTQADSLADVEKAMQVIRQMQEESGLDCAVGCLAKEANAALAVKLLTQTSNDAVRPDFGVLYSPDLQGLDASQMVTTTTPPCIIIGDQEDKNVKLMTDFYMAMTSANRRECELVLTHQQSTIDLALKRFLEDKFFTKSSAVKSSIAAIGDQYGWKNDSLYGDFAFNSVISLKFEEPKHQGRYASGKGGIRCYQWSGYYTIQARPGATIKSIKLTYSAWDTNQKGIVVKNWGTDGYDYPDSAKMESGKTYMVNANSIQLWTGSLGPKEGTTNQGTVCITGFEIVYEDALSVTDSYMSLTKESSANDEPFYGDGNLYSWKVKNYQRKASDNSDYVNNSLGIRLRYDSYLAMNGAQEGGIKDISFDYHTLNTTMPIHFFVKNGSTTLDEITRAKATNVGYVYNYTKVLNLKENAALSISIAAKESTEQTYITMGPITITPYLLYKTKLVTLKKEDMEDVGYKFTNKDLLNNTDGGTISYSVIGTNADKIASVDAQTGEVTVIGEGTVKIQAKWGNVTTSYQLAISTKEPGFHHVACTVTELAKKYNWVNGNDNNCYNYFELNDIISVTASSGNSKYLNSIKETECLRFYQGSNKGLFTIRAKAGVIIQSIKLDYHQDGVVTTDYGTNGASIPADKQVKSGVPFRVDGNVINLYVGSTDANTGKQVRIENFEVTYFIPETGATVTKSASDLGRELKLQNNTCYYNVAVNNAIKLHADRGDKTLKYYTSGNFNCYNSWGAIDLIARAGVKIHYIKITYNAGNAVVTTKQNGGTNLSAADYIASDSIVYVNANSFKFYVGSKAASYSTLALTKFYINYTDSNAIIDDFRNCPVLSSTQTVEVEGIDGIYNWQLTGFSRDSTHHLYYDRTTQLYKGGKMVADNAEGGMKEISFEWFASNKDQGAKFAVKAGTDNLATVDSAKTGGYYPVTFTKTGIKRNGALAIEIDAASGSQVEFNHISIIPYLRFLTREDSVDVQELATYELRDILIDNTDDAANIVYSIQSDETGGATIRGSEVDLSGAKQNGAVVVKAAWEQVSTTMTLHVETGSTPTQLTNQFTDSPTHQLTKIVRDNQVLIFRDGTWYTVLGIPMKP